MTITDLREAIVRIFEDEPNKRFTLKEIYARIKDCEPSGYEQDVDQKYPQPRVYHEARSVIAALEREGVIERLDRDRRRLKARA